MTFQYQRLLITYATLCPDADSDAILWCGVVTFLQHCGAEWEYVHNLLKIKENRLIFANMS